MKFIKLQSVYRKEINDIYQFVDNGSIIVNSSHIIDIYQPDTDIELNSDAAKKYSKMFDVPVSELCILKINLIDNRSWYVVIPEKKFTEFKWFKFEILTKNKEGYRF